MATFVLPPEQPELSHTRISRKAPNGGTPLASRRSPSAGAGLEILLRMSRQIDIRLSPNGEHSAKVADWAARTAALLGYEDQDIRDLFWAARLHDIGKIGIPDPVLSKTGPLNSEEWRLVRMHPTIGASLITALSPLAHLAPIVLSHQERYDGTGYPAGLQGQDIPIGARLLAVVDAYDAMTSDRVYRRALPHDTAVVELEQHAGRQFDPVAVEAFVDMVVPPA